MKITMNIEEGLKSQLIKVKDAKTFSYFYLSSGN